MSLKRKQNGSDLIILAKHIAEQAVKLAEQGYPKEAKSREQLLSNLGFKLRTTQDNKHIMLVGKYAKGLKPVVLYDNKKSSFIR